MVIGADAVGLFPSLDPDKVEKLVGEEFVNSDLVCGCYFDCKVSFGYCLKCNSKYLIRILGQKAFNAPMHTLASSVENRI